MNPRVDRPVDHVDHQVHGKHNHNHDEGQTLHHRVVARDCCLNDPSTRAWNAEDHLQDNGSGHEGAKLERNDRYHGDDGLPQRVIVNELVQRLEASGPLVRLIAALRNALQYRRLSGASIPS